jgi:hypothetical protein
LARKKSTNGETVLKAGTLPVESEYHRLTDAEVRKLAMGIHGGQVFVSWQLREHEMNLLTNVFMPLLFLSDIDRMSLKRNEVIHFYGHMKDAADRSINGLPMFFSVGYLDKQDCDRIVKELKFLDAYMNGEANEVAE